MVLVTVEELGIDDSIVIFSPSNPMTGAAMTMIIRSRKRPFTMSMGKSSLLLLALPFGCEAFSSSAPLLSRWPSATPTVRHAATLDNNASEAPELRPDQSPSPVGTIPTPGAAAIASDVTPMLLPTDAIQSRSLDRDAIINSSVILLAMGIVLEHVLSVDVGITRGWTATEIAERVPIDNWLSYTDVLNMAPLRTKAMTSAAVYAIGDVIAQSREEDNYSIGTLDRWRVLRSLAAGLIGHGPMSHVWYRVSEDFFDNVLNLHAWWDFVPKVVVDQTIFGPVWNNSYILLLGLMQLHTPSRIWEDIKRTTVPLILSGLRLWPFVHCITYGLIPVENRLLWVDAVEIVWVTILASEASASSGDEEGDDGTTMEGWALAADREEEDGIR